MLKLIKTPHQIIRDIELAQKIYRGDHKSISYLISHYTGVMRSTALRITQNEADTDDCVQIALINALDHIDQFKGASSLEAWLKGIATNTALMHLRSQSRRKEESIDSFSQLSCHTKNPLLTTLIFRDTQLVEDIVYQKETRLAILEALSHLPQSHRAAFIARDIMGFNTKETASLLGITSELVRTRLRRARLSLRSYLEPFCRSEAA